MFYVYVLLSGDNRSYIGCCFDLKEWFKLHQKGKVDATKSRLPVKLATYFAFSDKYTAFNFEKYLKSGSDRGFIKNII